MAKLKKASTVKEIKSIADLVPDAQNVNRGTERGVAMLEYSLQQYGAGRSIVIDKEGRVIAGNKTLEQAAEMGLEIEVIRTDGTKLVVVQREDLDLEDKGGKARGLAIADNRVQEISYSVDPAMLALHSQSMNLSSMYSSDELAQALGQALSSTPQPVSTAPVLQGNTYQVIIVCKDEAQQVDLLGRFEEEGLECRALIS